LDDHRRTKRQLPRAVAGAAPLIAADGHWLVLDPGQDVANRDLRAQRGVVNAALPLRAATGNRFPGRTR
jgi:hypothetical protein